MSEASLKTFVWSTLAICIAAFAVNIDWLGVISFPVAVWSGFAWAKRMAISREKIRLDEADRWDHLLWRIVTRPSTSEDGLTHTCYYCERTWTSGHGDDAGIHKESCGYQWWQEMREDHQTKRQLWMENRR